MMWHYVKFCFFYMLEYNYKAVLTLPSKPKSPSLHRTPKPTGARPGFMLILIQSKYVISYIF